jgi:hypothetical protein
MKKEDAIKWAWLGGFMDGEGSFYLVLQKRYANKSGFRMPTVVDVSNTDMRLINRVIEITEMGTIRKCTKEIENHKPSWKVDFKRHEVIKLIPKLLPFLVSKKRQAEIIYELAVRMSGHNVRYSQTEWNEIIKLYNECRMLNRRGTKPYVPVEPSEVRPARFAKSSRVCDVDGCNYRHYGKGYCRKHYRKFIDYTRRKKSVNNLTG